MKRTVLALAVAAGSGVAIAQEPPATPWQFFENEGGRNGATVEAADGAQLVLKCDTPGRREVHAMLVASDADRLAAPTQRPLVRPVSFQFDGGSVRKENWSFFERYVMASGKGTDRALARFVVGLRGSSRVVIRLETGMGPDVDMTFDTTGSREAIERVYEKCRDSVPA